MTIPRLWSKQWLGCKRLHPKVGGSKRRLKADEGSLAEAAAAEQLAAIVEHTSGTVSSLASFAALAITAPKEAPAADRLARGLSKTPGKFGAIPVMEICAIGTHFLPFRKSNDATFGDVQAVFRLRLRGTVRWFGRLLSLQLRLTFWTSLSQKIWSCSLSGSS